MASTVDKRISDAVWYITALYEDAKDNQSRRYQTETYRVIILYVISIIEALLFEKYESLGDQIMKDEYKEAAALPATLCKPQKGEIVICRKIATPKSESGIHFSELLDFLVHRVITKETADRIKKINRLRNTFHLRKRGTTKCTIKDVEESLQLLDLVLRNR